MGILTKEKQISKNRLVPALGGRSGWRGSKGKKGKNAEKNHIQNADYMLMNMT